MMMMKASASVALEKKSSWLTKMQMKSDVMS